MKTQPTTIDGVCLVAPDVYADERGFFLENYRFSSYEAAGIGGPFVQDNLSRSQQGVLRGLHFQVKRPQAQLLTVVRGRIYDVVVDLREESTTFGRWFGAELSDDGTRQVYMAPGLAHGFCVLSDWADLHYRVSREYDPHDEGGLLWSDPEIAIAWPLETPIVSRRDAAFPALSKIGKDSLPHVAMG